LVDTSDALSQPRVKRIGPDDEAVGFLVHSATIASFHRAHIVQQLHSAQALRE